MASKPELLSTEGTIDGELYLSGSDRGTFEDRDQLVKLGKKPVLKRNFSFWSMLSLSVTVLITWEGSLVLFSQGLVNGGSGGLIYTFIVIWIGNLSMFSALSEVVSIAPTSGGQYHWVYMLAPKSSRKLLSFVTGWVTVAGWHGSVASATYLCGGMIQGLTLMTVRSYQPTGWQGTLLSIAVTALCVVVAVFFNYLLPKIEVCILVLHVTAFFGILITLATMGADAAFHLAEEMHRPSSVIPRSIITGILLNGALGLAMMICICFSLVNLPDGEPQFIFPMFDIFYAVTKSTAGAAAMGSIILTMGICATVGFYVTTSRVLWSFARDHGVPFWRTVSQVSQTGKVPVWAVSITAVITCLLTLINIGSDVALNDVLSLSISCLHLSYLLVLSFLLYNRITGAIAEPNSITAEEVSPDQLIWGPFRIGGILGITNNIFAIMYAIFILFFSFWPPAIPVQPSSMNYSCLVTGSVIVFSLGYYFVRARKQYNGPVIEFSLHRQIRVNATMATNGESSAANPSDGGRNNPGQDRKQRFGGSRFNSNNQRKKGRGGKSSDGKRGEKREGTSDWREYKRRKVDSAGEAIEAKNPFSKDEIAAEERRPKRKVAVMIGYSGTGYKGMQVNGDEPTIERDLFQAFIKAGAISKANADDPRKSSLARCARTDKGVHAAGNVISLKLIIEDEDIVDKINEALPEQIRIWGIQRTNNSFNCYQYCDSRFYEYLLPSYCLLPPHPQTFLGQKLVELNKEYGYEEEYNANMADVKNFWAEVEENDIKPILAKLDPEVRAAVMERIHSMDDPEAEKEEAAKESKDDKPAAEEAPAADAEQKPVAENPVVLTSSKPKGRDLGPVDFALRDIKAAYINAKRNYRITPERRDRLQAALDKYTGTRNFHNYTVQKTYGDPSAKLAVTQGARPELHDAPDPQDGWPG
ncbi:hypothetical protein NLG97_g6426 [Lecanicillium saksenae]|uniref:Uncharacterized protein n=1 Tax=Lecanicillium saksenae TaxID=468837 RepID=A0ACC1QTG4_9HYPO|nr:hypothetical protein NLG97_g6426 [Lecanicillium saksenae]